MEQFEALWLFQAEDMKADAIANAIKRSPTRQKLEKTRDLILERQKQYKQIESDTADKHHRAEKVEQDQKYEDAKMYSTVMPSSVYVLMKYSQASMGFCAGWSLVF